MPFDVPSISFGFERRFSWRKKYEDVDPDSTILEHGSIVIMNGNFQLHYQHNVPPMDNCMEESKFPFRINLTFRHIKKPYKQPTKDTWASSTKVKEAEPSLVQKNHK